MDEPGWSLFDHCVSFHLNFQTLLAGREVTYECPEWSKHPDLPEFSKFRFLARLCHRIDGRVDLLRRRQRQRQRK